MKKPVEPMAVGIATGSGAAVARYKAKRRWQVAEADQERARRLDAEVAAAPRGCKKRRRAEIAEREQFPSGEAMRRWIYRHL